ncbi:MAG: hypothetical protein NVS2B3_12780 [Vulcanimicrobiaceae bacterium]
MLGAGVAVGALGDLLAFAERAGVRKIARTNRTNLVIEDFTLIGLPFMEVDGWRSATVDGWHSAIIDGRGLPRKRADRKVIFMETALAPHVRRNGAPSTAIYAG